MWLCVGKSLFPCLCKCLLKPEATFLLLCVINKRMIYEVLSKHLLPLKQVEVKLTTVEVSYLSGFSDVWFSVTIGQILVVGL